MKLRPAMCVVLRRFAPPAALLLALSPARAQDFQPTPPISSELPTRVEEKEAHEEVREAKPLIVEELERAPLEAGLKSVQGRVAGVDARRGELRIRDEAGMHVLRTDAGTVFELDGRPSAGLFGVVPGADVRASYGPDGVARQVEVRPPPEPRDEAEVPLRRLPKTNATAPNPSAPEPTSDPAPGNQPGGLPP